MLRVATASIALALALPGVLATSQAAAFEESPPSESEFTSGDQTFEGEKYDRFRQKAGPGQDNPRSLWFEPVWGEGDDGERCYTIAVDQDTTEAAHDGSTDPGDNTSWTESDDVIAHWAEGGRAEEVNQTLRDMGLGKIQLPEERCPGNEPDDLVDVLWDSELCPPPPPSPLHMDPENSALTGMPGYLEIGGDNPAVVPCLGEEIIATARYVIHWGDGHTTETTSQGGSYADDGDVRHTYADRGDVEIVVEAYWRGEWNGRDLGEVTNPTRETLDLEVTELQSVRTSSGS